MLDAYILPSRPAEGGSESLNPNVHVIESEDTYGKVAVEPLHRGFGLTIGNPLRRILLSSTNGSAITWVKIDDVVHEYTAIPGVKEEVMELLLNVKRIRIRSRSERAGKMRLNVTGEGRVCAGDISTSSDFEIVNPELHLATLDSVDSHLSIEFNVEQGVGYQPAAQSDGTTNPPVGLLPVDAIFSPVRKVNYSVERTRVGQITNYERLVLEVWTDGTIKPVEAVRDAANRLVDQFFLFANLDRTSEPGLERPPVAVSLEIYQTPIERLDLSPRTLNCLKRAHITKVGELLEMTDDELRKIRNFGEKSLVELRERLSERGIYSPRGRGSEEHSLAAHPAGEDDSPALVSGLSTEDIGELMGGGDPLAPSGDGRIEGGLWSDEDADDEEDEDDWEDTEDIDEEDCE
jgi:DNA-directed RNA polymerase subunit alpha